MAANLFSGMRSSSSPSNGTFMWVGIYVHVCIHVYMYTCIYIYICMYVYMHIYLYMYLCIYVDTSLNRM
jgi:hypothetical protein